MKLSQRVIINVLLIVSQGSYLSGAGLSPYEQRVKDRPKQLQEQEKLNQSFINAVKSGVDQKTVSALLAKGARVNSQNEEGNTALFYVKDLPMLRFLLDNGADISITNLNGDTVFLYLMMKSPVSNLDILRFLIQAGVPINAQNTDGNTALMLAIQRKLSSIIDLLLANKADVNLKNHNGDTVLMMAIRDKFDINFINALLSQANVNQKNDRGLTALSFAVDANDFPVITKLILAGADPNVLSVDGGPLLISAIHNNKMNVVQLLLTVASLDPDVTDSYGNTALNLVVKNNEKVLDSFSLAQRLLEKKANPNIADKRGVSPLLFTIQYKNLPLAKLLLNAGADPNKQNNSGEAPLLAAIKQCNIEMVQLLLNNNADPNIRSNTWGTPLDQADITFCPGDNINQKLFMVHLLLDKKANPIISGYGPFDYIKHANRSLKFTRRLIQIFNRRGLLPKDFPLDEEEINEYGETELLLAVINKKIDDIQILIAIGDNPYLEDSFGLNSFDYVQDSPEILAILGKTKFKPSRVRSLSDQEIEIRKDRKKKTRLSTDLLKAADINEVRKLLAQGADPNVESIYHTVPFLAAVNNGDKQRASLFITNGAKIDAMNQAGETPLIRYVAHENIPQVQLLIELGANPYLQDKSGLNAFDYAKDFPKILTILQTTKHKPGQEQLVSKVYEPKKTQESLQSLYRSLFQIPSVQQQAHIVPSTVYERAEGHTTSEVYVSVFRDEILKKYSKVIDQNRIDILTLLAREREYFDDYYVFYHSQEAIHRIAQDFFLEILALTHLSYPKDFIPIRFWHGQDIFKDSDPEKFIPMMELQSDNDREIGQHLVAVNIALFGNLSDPEECSLDFYLYNHSMKRQQLKTILDEIITFYDFNRSLIGQLYTFELSLVTQFGSILQILIPKNLVNHCIYLCHRAGKPFTEDLGLKGYDKKLHYQAEISPILEAIQSGTVPNDKLTKVVLDVLQARIIIGSDIMLDPAKGVKIFRQVALPKAKLDAYQHEVQRIALEVIIDWLQMITSRDLAKNKELIARLQGTPLAEIVNNKEKALDLLFHLQGYQRENFPKPQPPKPAVPSKL